MKTARKAKLPPRERRPVCDTPGCGREIPVGGEGSPEICPTCLAKEADTNKPRKHSHYFKPVPYTHVDVYRVLKLFDVTDPCIQHAVKKLLVAGGRGTKDIRRDVQEAIDTMVRWQEMRDEEGAAGVP